MARVLQPAVDRYEQETCRPGAEADAQSRAAGLTNPADDGGGASGFSGGPAESGFDFRPFEVHELYPCLGRLWSSMTHVTAAWEAADKPITSAISHWPPINTFHLVSSIHVPNISSWATKDN